MELKKQIEDLQNIPLNNAKSNEFIEKMNSIETLLNLYLSTDVEK